MITEEKKRRSQFFSTIMFALLNVAFMISFVWHTELFMVDLMLNGGQGTFTNGFFDTPTAQVYHVWMYLMFFMGMVSSYHLIRLSLKQREAKKDD